MKIRAKNLFSKETRDGLIMLNQEEDEIFVLNETASRLWNLCASKDKMSIDDILDIFKKEYSINGKELEGCRKDCVSIIKQNPELFEILKG